MFFSFVGVHFCFLPYYYAIICGVNNYYSGVLFVRGPRGHYIEILDLKIGSDAVLGFQYGNTSPFIHFHLSSASSAVNH